MKPPTTPERSLGIAMLACLLFVPAVRADLSTGSSVEEVVATLGAPDMKINQGARLVYYYAGGAVEFENGAVAAYDDDLFHRVEKREDEQAFEKQQLEKGLVKLDGNWMTQEQAHELRTEKEKTRRTQQVLQAKKRANRKNAARSAGQAPSVTVVRNGGKKIALAQYTKKGQVTIVDFFADWCGPCRKISPYLEQVANGNHGVHLVKVDIVNWETPIVRQFKLTSIPNMRVFDRSGKQVGSATSSLTDVRSYLKKAY